MVSKRYVDNRSGQMKYIVVEIVVKFNINVERCWVGNKITSYGNKD